MFSHFPTRPPIETIPASVEIVGIGSSLNGISLPLQRTFLLEGSRRIKIPFVDSLWNGWHIANNIVLLNRVDSCTIAFDPAYLDPFLGLPYVLPTVKGCLLDIVKLVEKETTLVKHVNSNI